MTRDSFKIAYQVREHGVDCRSSFPPTTKALLTRRQPLPSVKLKGKNGGLDKMKAKWLVPLPPTSASASSSAS